MHTSHRRCTTALQVLVLAACIASCSGNGLDAVKTLSDYALSLSPASFQMETEGTADVTCMWKDKKTGATGNPTSFGSQFVIIAWSTGVISVRSAGAGHRDQATITALKDGTDAVQCGLDGTDQTLRATVVVNTPAFTMTTSPSRFDFILPDAGNLTITATHKNGAAVAASALTLTSLNPAVATVTGPATVTNGTATARVTAVASGTATIRVAIAAYAGGGGGGSVDVPVVVTAPLAITLITMAPDSNKTLNLAEGTKQLTAVAKDANGQVVPNVAFAWASLNPSVATVSASGGLATAVSPGNTQISVRQANNPSSPVGFGAVIVTTSATCNLQLPDNTTRSLRFTVASDPGSNATAIALPGTVPVTFVFTNPATATKVYSVIAAGGGNFVTTYGGFLSTACDFASNGMGAVAGKQNVGTRLSGTWTATQFTGTYTMGTNGELSGGPTVYNVVFP